MITNCLVTKLKSVVDNDNLDYLNKFRLTIELTDNFPSAETNVMAFDSQPSLVENLNTDGAAIRMDDNYLAITKGSTNTVKMFISKYGITNINIFNSNVRLNLSDIAKFYGLKILNTGEAVRGGLANVTDFKSLETLKITNCTEGSVDISIFTSVPTLKVIDLGYCNCLKGDLSSIKDMPNLESIKLDHTYVTDMDNAVDYMTNRGINVTYVPYT